MDIATHKANVITVVTFDCGCGYRTDVEREAQEHASTTNHTMTIHGRVLAERPYEVEMEAR